LIAAGSSTPHNPQTGRFDPQFVAIRDGRPLLGELSLDKQGFEFIRHKTWVNDFYDRQEVERVYYRGRESTQASDGASKVVIFEVRCLPLAERGEKGA